MGQSESPLTSDINIKVQTCQSFLLPSLQSNGGDDVTTYFGGFASLGLLQLALRPSFFPFASTWAYSWLKCPRIYNRPLAFLNALIAIFVKHAIARMLRRTIAPGHWKTQFRVGGRFARVQPLSQPVSPSSESSPSPVASRAPSPSTDRNPDVHTASLIDEISLSLNIDAMTDNNDAPPPPPLATLSPETLAMIAAITAVLRPQNQPPVQPPPPVVPPFTGLWVQTV
ncbi:hypothetical protein B0H13DRAFT_2333812 [Mycena leptocephala]|nr:hypothetical protein B0H13DRAFT_2333812 [Mycena leptocephala]